jgi:hypothetical protein
MKRVSTFTALLFLIGCAANRYEWNLAHARVTARPPLARADLEQIIRVVTQATVQPIVSVYRVDNTHVSVIAATSVGYVEDLESQKIGQEWRITSHEQQLDR